VIAKIIMHNIFPKSREFGRARGCTSLLIYCILPSLPVNLPQLIFDIKSAPNIASKSLPFRMLLTLLFRHWGIDLSGEDPTPPPAPLDHGFLNTKQSHLLRLHVLSIRFNQINPLLIPLISHT